MKPLSAHTLVLLLSTLAPLAASSAPPPYWPPYPPSPYYPMPVYPPTPLPSNTETTTEVEPNGQGIDDTPPEGQELTKKSDGAEVVSEDRAATGDAWELDREIRAAIQQGNFAEAYYLWRPRAEAGDANAQYGIGWMYHNGYGLAIDDEEASAWWELAARQGHTDAIFALGMLYGLGEGPVRRDMPRAVTYYHQAARKGHEDARLLLRTLMAEGDEAARELMQQLLSEDKVSDITPPAVVTKPRANVRHGPGTKHKVLATLMEGHALMPLKREGRWLLVGIKGKAFTGWIHDSLVNSDVLSTSAN